MARSFSEREREQIRKHLLEACKQSWTQFGYKKTSVDELCVQVGISKGAFYLFYESKEALFCEVLCSVQEQLYTAASQKLEEQGGKSGAVEALKLIYREYDRNHFLCETSSTDFTVLMNKLSEEQARRIEESGRRNRQLFADHPGLRLKVDADMAVSVIYALIMNIKNRGLLPRDHVEVFDFMAGHLIDDLYE